MRNRSGKSRSLHPVNWKNPYLDPLQSPSYIQTVCSKWSAISCKNRAPLSKKEPCALHLLAAHKSTPSTETLGKKCWTALLCRTPVQTGAKYCKIDRDTNSTSRIARLSRITCLFRFGTGSPRMWFQSGLRPIWSPLLDFCSWLQCTCVCGCATLYTPYWATKMTLRFGLFPSSLQFACSFIKHWMVSVWNVDVH